VDKIEEEQELEIQQQFAELKPDGDQADQADSDEDKDESSQPAE
jgi:hypothetical protein